MRGAPARAARPGRASAVAAAAGAAVGAAVGLAPRRRAASLRARPGRGTCTRLAAAEGDLWDLDVARRLNDLASSGDVAGTEEVFQQIKEMEWSWEGAKATKNERMLYNTVLKAMANKGDVAAAARWQQRMRDDGIQPNQQTFGKLMEAAAHAGMPDEAEEWYRELLAEGLSPEVAHFGCLVEACGRAKQPARYYYYYYY